MRTYVPALVLTMLCFAGSLCLGGNVGMFAIGVFYTALLVVLVVLPENVVRKFLDTDWTRRRQDVP